jgi:predicted DsbA family dithiol-disulfide isomerase
MSDIEIYTSIECPYAYLAAFRLSQLMHEWEGRVNIQWSALSLEFINRSSYAKPLYEAEYALFKQIEPDLPWKRWDRPDWHWPTTFWPAFEALACAQSQGKQSAFEMSYALRSAHFAECRNISLRHELFDIASSLAKNGTLDLEHFQDDWDHGRFRFTVFEESRKGWQQLKLDGSATLILADGRRTTNPAVGEIDFDEEHGVLRSFTPYAGDPLDVYRNLLAID